VLFSHLNLFKGKSC